MRAAAIFFLLPVGLVAQTKQQQDWSTLGRSCVPQAPSRTLQAIIHTESGGNPYALAIDYPNTLLRKWNLPAGTLRLARQPHDKREALDWIDYFERFHISVDVGLMQVSTAEAQRRGIKTSSLLDPCTNLRVGWTILDDFYQLEAKRYGPGQTALAHSISRYNTGDSQRGIDNGYFGRVLAALRLLPAQEGQR
jgi:type IV secretion system protein VirB1